MSLILAMILSASNPSVEVSKLEKIPYKARYSDDFRFYLFGWWDCKFDQQNKKVKCHNWKADFEFAGCGTEVMMAFKSDKYKFKIDCE